jgi:signal-transduction protein with cAMP-binding, CBS, and nucleotidyltransferase domain
LILQLLIVHQGIAIRIRAKFLYAHSKLSRREEMITVADVMRRDIITVQANTGIGEAAKILIEKGIGSVGVEKEGRIAGIVTDRDFVRFLARGGKAEKAEEIMSSPPITVDAGEGLLEAVRAMGKNKVRHLFVEESGDIVGILSLRDVLAVTPEYIAGYIAQNP